MSRSDSNALGAVTAADTEVEKVVVDLGLATKSEMEFCREQQKQSSDPNQRSLTDLLVEHNFITANQAKRIRAQMDERRSGQIPGYHVIAKVGKGAMAVVYKARQISLDRIVAIKVLPKRLSENPDFVERFYKEGKAAARLAHNNIVQAIDVGSTQDNYHYFVMEFVEGKTLYDIMATPPHGDGKSFTEKEALDITGQIAEALAHAHLRGLVHRDVKPKNILLTPQGVAKLTDLGLARATDDKAAAESEAGKAYGTPYYISPEQIRGEVDIDFRADIYSLGATLYHLVTGRPPFDGDTPSAVMHKHLKSALTPADHLNTSLSQGTAEIIEFCMSKKRSERYSSCEDLVEDLKLVREGRPPAHARHHVDMDALTKIEETATNSDPYAAVLRARASAGLPNQILIIGLGAVIGISVVLNLVLMYFVLLK
jgi:eukaryotic-like serine/threonine-protein kinase